LWDGIKWTYGRLRAAHGKPVHEVVLQNIKQADGAEVTILQIKEE
jgi:hypothetical protein